MGTVMLALRTFELGFRLLPPKGCPPQRLGLRKKSAFLGYPGGLFRMNRTEEIGSVLERSA